MRQRLLSSSVIGGFAAAGLAMVPAVSQPTERAAAQPSGEEEVVVTGTRIKQPNLTAVSPLTSQNDTDIKLQGTTNIESLLNNLPQTAIGVDGQTSTVSNGSSGTATVSLRGLGVTRTLVLVDGRRLMPGDPSLPVPDLNNIPSALVDRVEVVTGGASAVYGSDAIAGVVNFIMKRDFEGVRVDAQYSFSNHTNDNNRWRDLQGEQGISFYERAPSGNNSLALSKDVTLTLGTNTADGKGNITAYLGYRELEAVLQQDFDVSACSLIGANVNDPDSYVYDGFACSGSSNSAFGRFNVVGANPGAERRRMHVNPNGTREFITANVPAFNYGPVNYFQRPDTRYTGGFFAHYELAPEAEVYSDFMFTDDHTVAQIAPSGLFANTGPNLTSTYQINCDNPLLTAAQQVQLCGPAAAGTSERVNTSIGYRFTSLPRQDDLRHTQYKMTVGLRGDFAEAWSYDIYGQYGTSIFNEHYNNDVSTTKVQRALLVDPVTGQCISGTTDGCVPLDIFRYGALTEAMTNYTVAKGFKSGQTEEEIVSAVLTGDLGEYGWKMPWATNGISIALGFEYRRESLELSADEEFSSGDLSGQGGPTLSNSGAYDVYEFFGEARLPIIEGQPFADVLAIDLGYRYSDYGGYPGATSTSTYKVDAEWGPVKDLRFRAGYNRAVRAPNVVELFLPNQIGLFSGADPCAGANPSASAAACALSGVSAAQYGNIEACPAGQCSALFSGNEFLKPEEADTFTVGFVVTPSFSGLEGLTASVDYFSVKIKDYLNANPLGVLLSCVSGNVAFCGDVHRDSTGAIFGSEGFVDAKVRNTGFLKTAGVDLSLGYRADLDDWGMENGGRLSFNLLGTWTDKLEFQPVTGSPTYDCVGLYGPTCGAPLPAWRHQFRVSYEPAEIPLTVSILWRHLGSADAEALEDDNIFLSNHPSGVTQTADRHIKAYDYFDVAGTYTVDDRYTIRLGVNNVFDKDPPGLDSNLIPTAGPPTGNGNTYPGVYDVFGRTIFVGITADF
jgi:outer membrane receptor protein involved in Fe transport